MKTMRIYSWKRVLLSLTLGSLLATVEAQGPDPHRIKQIWDVAQARFDTQNDHWFERGDFPRCVQLLRLTAELAPNNYEIVTNLGWMLGNIGAYDEELAVYVRFRRNNPKDSDAAFPEADFYFRKKAYANVPSLLEPTLKSEPHPNTYRLLAHCYEKLGLLEDSKRVWTAYLLSHKEDDAARNNLNRIERKLKGIKP